jgi:hypothetical protein
VTTTVARPRRHRPPNPGRVLNYTTSIAPEKTLIEIQQILVAHGARSFSLRFDDQRNVSGFSFTMDIDDVERSFEFQANSARVRARMIAANNKGKTRYQRGYWTDDPGSFAHNVPSSIDAQARRTAWRIIKDGLEAQLNMADAGVADAGQILFGFAMLDHGGTIYESFLERQMSLPAGPR